MNNVVEKSIKSFSEHIPFMKPSDPGGEQLREMSYAESTMRFEENTGYLSSAKLAVNNFLKTIDEIESEFKYTITGPGNDDEIWCSMEQNY